MATKTVRFPLDAAVTRQRISGGGGVIVCQYTDGQFFLAFSDGGALVRMTDRGDKIKGCASWGEVYITVEADDVQAAGSYAELLISDEADASFPKGEAGGSSGAQLVSQVIPGNWHGTNPFLAYGFPNPAFTAPTSAANFFRSSAGNFVHATSQRYGTYVKSNAGATAGRDGFQVDLSASWHRGVFDAVNPLAAAAASAPRGAIRITGDMFAVMSGGVDDEGTVFFGVAAPPSFGVARGAGFLAGIDGIVRCIYRTYAGVAHIDVSSGVNVSGFPVVELESGDLGDGPYMRWKVNGETIHEISELPAAYIPTNDFYLQHIANKTLAAVAVDACVCSGQTGWLVEKVPA